MSTSNTPTPTTPTAEVDLDEQGLGALFEALARRGLTVVGPAARDGAIVLAEFGSADELPYGWGVEVEAGTYRLHRGEDRAAFAHSAGPQSWKTFFHPPRARPWQADRALDRTVTVQEDDTPPPRYAFLGVRPCDLRVIAVQDRVLTGGWSAPPPAAATASGSPTNSAPCRTSSAPPAASAVDAAPRNPLGAPMVSGEGTCAAFHAVGRRKES
ncbi:hypothetical protein [Kitasatospora sp. P5_F3]